MLSLRKRFTGGTHQRIVFSDEKIFTVEMTYNRQNSRILAPDQKSIAHQYVQSKELRNLHWLWFGEALRLMVGYPWYS